MRMEENMEKLICEKCGKVIRGYTKNEVIWNMNIHKKSKHNEEEKCINCGTIENLTKIEGGEYLCEECKEKQKENGDS
jgi:hypothetical protein